MISIMLVLLLILIANVLNNALTIVVLSVLIGSLVYRFPNVLKRAYIFYVLFFLIGIASFLYYDTGYVDYIVRGFLGYALFFVVMFVGVLPNKWDVSRKIKKHRGTLSILGFLAITPHALLHVLGYFNSIDLFGVAAYVLIIPLTIISFKVIKREIDVKDWNTIQKGAYGIYILLFTHLLVVSSWDNKIVYIVLATLYINNKLYKELRK